MMLEYFKSFVFSWNIMASHMGVQTFATARNSLVELFVQFILESYFHTIQKSVTDLSVESQKQYKSKIASDVWDHFASFCDKKIGGRVDWWCQTTCYKGNSTGKPEPNKTYEIRETLVEAISLRERVLQEAYPIRTIHFTVGSKKYTYDWFVAAKNKTFDLSIYIDVENEDVFECITKSAGGSKTEMQVKQSFENALKKPGSFSKIVTQVHEALYNWHIKQGMQVQEMANKQYLLVANEMKLREIEMKEKVKHSVNAGLDIKRRCNDVVHGKPETDPILVKTTEQLLDTNPFIRQAKYDLANWEEYSKLIATIEGKSKGLSEFITSLWNTDGDQRLVIRRLLFRIKADAAINYIQDINVVGVTEHTLYKGNHKDNQVQGICLHLISRLKLLNIESKSELKKEMTSKAASSILKSALWFEAKNGTTLKPSFDYIVNVLSEKGYVIKDATSFKNKPIGFQSQFVSSAEKVNAYTNLRVIFSKEGLPIAYLKGKYFRPQELPRRCKEESYVGLTLKYELKGSDFTVKNPFPLIMFIDMPGDYTPPPHAITQLQAFGWNIAFNGGDVIEILKNA